MTPAPKLLTGDQAAIQEFIDKFDVRQLLLGHKSATQEQTSLTCNPDIPA